MYKLVKNIYQIGTDIGTDIEPVSSLLKDVILWGEKKFIERRNETINKFYIQLFEGNVTEERIKYEKEHIQTNSEQYYTLLNLAINDEEQEKDFIYANVYKYIRDHQELEKRKKIKLIKITKQLPYSALEILPYIYICYNFNVKSNFRNKLQLEIVDSHKYELNILSQLNIIPQNDKLFYTHSQNNDHLNEICVALFTKKDLNPFKYNIELWRDIKVLIMSKDPFVGGKAENICKRILIDNSILAEESTIHNVNTINFGLSNSDTYLILAVDSDVLLTEILECPFYDKNNPKIIKVTANTLLKNSDKVLNLNKEEDIQKLRNIFSDL